MIDAVIIGNKSSYDDFEASVKERKIHKPKKKTIKDTVPFSNVTYDFSAINGEVYWEERELEYVFEIMADTPALLEQKKALFASWVMNVMEEELRDPFIEDYHFRATFDDMEEDDEDHVEKSTVTVKFTAYPYMIANEPKMVSILFETNATKEVVVVNNSCHPVTPTIVTDKSAIIIMGDVTFGVSTGSTTDDAFKLDPGINTFKVTMLEKATISFVFTEEIF